MIFISLAKKVFSEEVSPITEENIQEIHPKHSVVSHKEFKEELPIIVKPTEINPQISIENSESDLHDELHEKNKVVVVPCRKRFLSDDFTKIPSETQTKEVKIKVYDLKNDNINNKQRFIEQGHFSRYRSIYLKLLVFFLLIIGILVIIYKYNQSFI